MGIGVSRAAAGLCLVLLALLPGVPVRAASVTNVLASGAKALFCVPDRGWNGDLIVYAHGYTASVEPLDFQNLTLGDVYLPELVQALGFAFATTSYRQTGLAIVEGVEDVRDLVRRFPAFALRKPRRVLLVGASEGGIVTTLAIEKYPSVFHGGLALCGPIGDFRRQINYDADFRVLFDHYYPGLIPGSAISVPAEVRDHWYDHYEPLVRAAVLADPALAVEMLTVAKAAYVPGDMATVASTFSGVLWYQVFGTDDAKAKLGGNPFGNLLRRYAGSSDDAALNAGVARFRPELPALARIAPYQTTGRLARPLVVLHTTGDEIIPYMHTALYAAKLVGTGSSSRAHIIPVARYGHCNFQLDEVLQGFFLLLREMRMNP